jgi:hypothetical protein
MTKLLEINKDSLDKKYIKKEGCFVYLFNIILSPIRYIKRYLKKIDKKKILRHKIKNDFNIYNSWKNEHIIIGYSIKNSYIIIITKDTSDYYGIIKQIEEKWISGCNFIIIQVDINNVDFDLLKKINDNISSSYNNKISIFNFGDKKTDIHNIENYIIYLVDYYGIINNKFTCEYY